jgi:hypothetical protein
MDANGPLMGQANSEPGKDLQTPKQPTVKITKQATKRLA